MLLRMEPPLTVLVAISEQIGTNYVRILNTNCVINISLTFFSFKLSDYSVGTTNFL